MTLTTVGYDYNPETLLGKILGGCCALSGVILHIYYWQTNKYWTANGRNPGVCSDPAHTHRCQQLRHLLQGEHSKLDWYFKIFKVSLSQIFLSKNRIFTVYCLRHFLSQNRMWRNEVNMRKRERTREKALELKQMQKMFLLKTMSGPGIVFIWSCRISFWCYWFLF